ncbi:unnamed protein product [Cuscuta europaea]|uniref:Uncharacterized protein n=1 Tax=Cuscuta europaea TaxID=41803 RepID=A0A9P1DZA0_CUSEU|nr:unnamed protein product [Cuscuta europaea]
MAAKGSTFLSQTLHLFGAPQIGHVLIISFHNLDLTLSYSFESYKHSFLVVTRNDKKHPNQLQERPIIGVRSTYKQRRRSGVKNQMSGEVDSSRADDSNNVIVF